MRTIPFHPVSVPGSTIVGAALGWDDLLGHRLRDLAAAPIILTDFGANQILAKSNANVLITPIIGTNQLLGRRSGDITDILVGTHTVVARSSGDIAPVSMAVSSVLVRQGGNIVGLTVGTNRILLRDAGGFLDAFPLNNNEVLLRAGGNIVAHSMGADTVLVRQGADIVSLTMGNDTVLVKTATGNIEALSMGTNAVLLRAVADIVAHPIPTHALLIRAGGALGGHTININEMVGRFGTFLDGQAVAVQQLILRGSGNMASTTIPDSNFVGRPSGGNLGPMTAAQARTILNIAGGQQNPILQPIALYADNATTNTTMVDGTTYFLYVGRARIDITTVGIMVDSTTVQTPAVNTLDWAEMGVFTGAFVPNGNASLTRQGSADVQAAWDGLGPVRTAISGITGISAGDDVWIAYGNDPNAGGAATLRSLLPDIVQSGVFQSVSGKLSDLASPVATTLESISTRPAWVSMDVA